MKFVIEREFEFSSSHQLADLPTGHKCHRLHGHNYKVVIRVESTVLDNNGFVRDYADLTPFKMWLDAEVDHRHLNDVFPLIHPTAENLAVVFHSRAKELFHWLDDEYGPRISEVRVSETPKTWSIVLP